MIDQNFSQPLGASLVDPDNDLLRIYENETTYVVFNYFRIVTDCVKLFLCTCAIAVDLFMIYIFIRFKNLKRNTNRYILHYAIANVFYFVAPLLYLLIQAIDHISGYNLRSCNIMFCVIIQLENTCLTMCFLLALGLGVDWLITCYFGEVGKVWESIHMKYTIPILYFLGTVKFVAQSAFCFLEEESIRHIYSAVVYGNILTFALVLDYLSFSDTYTSRNTPNERKHTYSLVAVNVIVLSWLPMYVYYGLTQLAMGNENFELVLWYTVFLPEWIAYGSSILLFIILGKLSKPIKEASYKSFRRSVKNYENQKDLERSQSDSEIDLRISDNTYI